MTGVRFLFNLAVSLFVAPTPGLLLVMYANGGSTIPPAQGLVVLAISAAAYWIWLLDRRSRKDAERQVERVRHAAPESPESFEETEARAAQERLAAERRRAREALTGHDDLPDPLAEARSQPPARVLVDRVADLRQLKSLVTQNEVSLLNAFHRSVDRDEYGAPDYTHWAYEADRFLMSSALMARTLNRHESIAAVTAEIEHRVSDAGARRPARAEIAQPPARALLAPPQAELGARRIAPRPEDLVAEYAEAGAPEPGHRRISEALRQRLAARRTRGFAEDCAEILGRHGWSTQTTDSPGSDAIDLFAERGELIMGLRCRATVEPVGEDAVADVMQARDRFGLDAAGIVTASGFTTGARAAATINGICLLDEGDLGDLHLYVAQRKKVVPLFRDPGQQAQA